MYNYGIKNRFIISLIIVSVFSFGNLFALSGKGWSVVSQSTDKLVLKYSPDLISFDHIITSDGSPALIPNISDTYPEQSIPGMPVKLIASEALIVPGKGMFHISDFQVGGLQKHTGLMAPVPILKNIKGTSGEDYQVNPDYYNSGINNIDPKLEYAGIAGNRHIALLSLPAAYFHNSQIIIPSEYIVTVQFEEAHTKNHISSERISGSDLINHEQARDWFASDNRYSYDNKFPANKTLGSGSSTAVKIAISKEGIYKITASDLKKSGVNIPLSLVPTIKIFGTGGDMLSEEPEDAPMNMPTEQKIIVNTSTGGELESILFYASAANGFKLNKKNKFVHFINHFSDKNYYMMTWGGLDGQRAVALDEPTAPVVNKPTVCTKRIFREEEIINAFEIGSGRQWFGRSIFPTTFTDELPGLTAGKDIEYKIMLAHRSSYAGRFNIKQANNVIADIYLPNMDLSRYQDAIRDMAEVSVPSSDIIDRRSVLKFDYINSFSSSGGIPFFDYYEIHYPQKINAYSNEAEFFDDIELPGVSEYSVNGFSGNVIGFDVTDRRNPELLKNLGSGSEFKFKSEQAENNPHRYYISSKANTPEISVVSLPGLKSDLDGADMILITHKDLAPSAEEYKEYRDKQGQLSVKIVYTEDIFNEFAAGVHDVTAIRDFISYADDNWKLLPKYVFLWGDGHYDFRNIETQAKNFVPPYESADNVETFDAVYSYTSDDYYVSINGNDDIADLAIGRMPINSTKYGSYMVQKIHDYEQESDPGVWRTNITLIADDSPTSKGSDGTLHTNDSERLSKHNIISDIQQKKIYLPEFATENIAGGKRKPGVTQEFVNTVNNTGTLIVNWVGHGNPRVLSHEEIFERSQTIPQFLNWDKLFFMTAATCDFGRFDLTNTQSGAEELVLSTRGGAIGVFTATRVVWAGANAVLNSNFYDYLFTRNASTNKYKRIGQVACDLKTKRHDLNDLKFNLFGDPALLIHLPADSIAIDEINGLDPGSESSTITLKALSTVNVKGRIMELNSNKLKNHFNGTVIVSLFDSDNHLKVKDTDDSIHSITKFGGALMRGSFEVVNGKFEAEFIIPKDISFSDKNGRMFTYAYSDDKTAFAKGSTDRFKVGGIENDHNPDTDGPELGIFLDSRLFETDDFVQTNPKLIIDMKDKSGINTTGLGIGHKIEVWIDDNPKSLDMTEKFTTSSKEYGSGSVEEVLYGIAPGRHKIKVRTWDIYNNYSVAETYFRISDNKVVISDISNSPNPFKDRTVVKFVHSASLPCQAKLTVMTSAGAIVRTINATLNSAHNSEIEWDATNNNGQMTASGTYLYQLELTDNEGIRSSTGGVMFIAR